MLIILDLETTGLSAREDAIIEAAFIKYDTQTRKEVDRLHTFIHPEREIPEIVSQITNIFHKDIVDAPRFEQVRNDIQDFIEGIPLVGHNITFDISFLNSHGIDTSKNPKIDTFFIANIICFHEKSLNLGYLCEVFDIPLASAHRAIDDTIATAHLFFRLCDEVKKLGIHQKKILQYFYTHSSDVAARILCEDFFGCNKDQVSLEEISQIYESHIRKNQEKISQTFQTSKHQNMHKIIQEIDGFEPRESQKVMMDKVDKSFSHGEKILIEAPTGIGKTFAYLIPAIKHSLYFGESVFVSTSTKALQDQICYKDLEFLHRVYPHEFSSCTLKGKKNYLSIQQFTDFYQRAERREMRETSFILKIFFWSMSSRSGELDELDFYGEEYSFLGEIHAGNPFVFDEANLYRDIEFAIRARNKAKNSNIVITNNHILFADALSGGSILGEIKNLVIDEAHAIEDVITGALKQSISYDFLLKTLQKIEKKIIQEKKVLLPFANLKQQLLFDGAEFFSFVEGKLFEKKSLSSRYKTLLIESLDIFGYDNILQIVKRMIQNIQELIECFSDDTRLHLLCSGELGQLQKYSELLDSTCFSADFSENIYYLSHDENYGTQCISTVLSPGAFLKKHFWDTLDSVVLTSATLTMDENFEYIHAMLSSSEFETLKLESSFDYNKQALVCIPTDLGSIKNNNEQLIDFLGKFFMIVRGKTLVLFTAFSMIRGVYAALKIQLEKKGITLLAQSISGSKHKQIESFKKGSEHSILMGTDSFWEGIDIPGSDLQYLVIHKIPFPVPSDPIFLARSKLFQNAFEEYSIPKSIIKLKQGFGRLIRTQKDSGIVIFLDDRIHTTRWGKNFLAAFPQDIKTRYVKADTLLEIIHKAH